MKQNQKKVNSAKFLAKIYIYNQFYLNELVLWYFFLKKNHIEKLNSKNVQSLITMGEDRSFGNIF